MEPSQEEINQVKSSLVNKLGSNFDHIYGLISISIPKDPRPSDYFEAGMIAIEEARLRYGNSSNYIRDRITVEFIKEGGEIVYSLAYSVKILKAS
ncbi:MAG: hypothetical protein AABW56_04385 [Nanoarchaeota archaeon]